MTRERWLLILAVLTVWIVWGSTYFAIRLTLESMPPFRMAALRLGLAGLILMAFGRVRGLRLPTRSEWMACARVGLLLFLGGNGSVVFAEQTVSSGLVAVLVSSVPLWTVTLGWFQGTRATAAQWAGIVIGLVGVGILNLGGELSGNPVTALGLLAGSAAWAWGSILGKALPMPPGTMASGAQMLAGGVWLGLASLLTGETQVGAVTTSSWMAFVYLLTFGSLLAFTAYGYLLKHASLPLATSYAYVNPVVAVLLGTMFGGERLDAAGWAGLAVVVFGVVLVTAMPVRKVVVAVDG